MPQMQFTVHCWTLQRFLVILCGFSVACAEDWSYTNPKTAPDHWAQHFQTCQQIRQSPINFRKSETIFDPKLKPIKIVKQPNIQLSTEKYNVSNNGHSVMISFPPDRWYLSFTEDGDLSYSVLQMHFHWGSKNNQGAEHLLEGKSYSIEGHLVAYSKHLYGNSSQATSGAEGLAALGFWGEISHSSEHQDTFFDDLGEFESSLEDIRAPKSSKEIDPFDLSKILNHVNPSAYYRYSGSLTTPPCTPNVIWTVFQRPFTISEEQIEKLRSLVFPKTEADRHMQNNYRPVQPLNNDNSLIRRSVYVSWNGASKTTGRVLLASMVMMNNFL